MPRVIRYNPTNSFVSGEITMSMICETTVQEAVPPKVPLDLLWEHNLKPVFLLYPNGIGIKTFKELFKKTNGTPLTPAIFGYGKTKDLLKDIEFLVISQGKVFLDWGHWPTELPRE